MYNLKILGEREFKQAQKGSYFVLNYWSILLTTSEGGVFCHISSAQYVCRREKKKQTNLAHLFVGL